MVTFLLLVIIVILLFGASTVKSGIGQALLIFIGVSLIAWLGSLMGLGVFESLLLFLFAFVALYLGMLVYGKYIEDPEAVQRRKIKSQNAKWDAEVRANAEARKRELDNQVK